MSDEGRSGAPAIDYGVRIERALRSMVAGLLGDVASEGLPGDHRLLLSFATPHPGVVLSDELRRRYPQEMTVLLQHQFEELVADERSFSVTLYFSGRRERITVPLDALTSFADPEAEIGFGFQPPAEPSRARPASTHPSGASGEVVELAAFRRRASEDEPGV